MKLFCDHDELISELKAERDLLRTDVATLKAQLETSRADTIEALHKLALSKVSEPQVLTTDIIARRLGIPESAVKQIDFQRLGMQVEQ